VKPYEGYLYAICVSVGMTILVPRMPKGISPDQREAEKKILDRAAEIEKQARDESRS